MSRKSRFVVLITIIVLVLAIAVGAGACTFFRTPENPSTSTDDDTKPDDTKPDDTKPDDTKPDDTKPDDTKPDDTKPDDTKPDDTKPDDTKPDDTKPEEPAGPAELSIHFPELGNKYAGDCIYIKSGDVDILIDGGSRENSAPTITKYIDTYCTDGTLEYVIVTHGHQDHIAALAGNSSYESIFKHYECEVIIDFPKTNSNSQVLNRYYASRDEEVKTGATHYTALQCYNETDGAKRSYSIGEGIFFEILYNYYYDHKASDENDYSVCILLHQGENNYLLTGDLEESGEKYLVQYNTLPHCVFYKAGHHGSKTSSNDVLLSVIQPEVVCVCCVAGSTEYTSNKDNTFPTQDAINRIAKYTTKIYVTSEVDSSSKGYKSLNGDIVVSSTGGALTVTGSNHSIPLPETDWFAANRTLPA